MSTQDNSAKVVSILQMILTAEPAVVQLVHDLLAKANGKADADLLTADIADWETIIATAKQQLGQ